MELLSYFSQGHSDMHDPSTVVRGKKIAPGTITQHDEYVRQHDSDNAHGPIIRAYRQFSIFVVWADGSEDGPALPAISVNKLKWLIGQATRPKYLKWYRKVDPAGWSASVAANPSYATQGAPVILEIAATSIEVRGAA